MITTTADALTAMTSPALAALDLVDIDDKPAGVVVHGRRSTPAQDADGQFVAVAHGHPAWLDQVAAYLQRAAAEGKTVTLTAKRRMLTPEQVADALGVSRPTISRRIKAGELRR
ncbi:helix-turn-helix domain-containing protein [Microbacterium sp. BWT-B31]|uniref:helix-turn-helix transcriptional regulator n=1 Tax=Microbacterium sp. BWT-B31 TaxID=3232072 RepID=UPI00352915D4